MKVLVGSLIGYPKTLPDLLEEGLSRPELIEATGLTVDRLMSWYKRVQLPARFIRATGSGNKRRYDIHEVFFLALTRALADAGLPMADATVLAERFQALVERVILEPLALSDVAEAILRLDDYEPSTFMISRRPANLQRSPSANYWSSPGFMAVGMRREDLSEIGNVMRENDLELVAIMDVVNIAVYILTALVKILVRR